jgi:KaiC/GvpD/RAD55 family RecA-like ATPase
MLLLKLIKEFSNVIWVTTTRSAKAVRKIIKREDIWIIDTYTGVQTKSHPRDIIISDFLNLNKISVDIDHILNNMSGRCLLVFDSISGLLIYHPVQKVIQFLRGLLVRIEGLHSGVFTLIKNAHDRQTELTIYMMFPSIIEFIRRDYDDKTARLVKVVKATEFIDPDLAEFKITKDNIVLPNHIEKYILKQLGIHHFYTQSQDIYATIEQD